MTTFEEMKEMYLQPGADHCEESHEEHHGEELPLTKMGDAGKFIVQQGGADSVVSVEKYDPIDQVVREYMVDVSCEGGGWQFLAKDIGVLREHTDKMDLNDLICYTIVSRKEEEKSEEKITFESFVDILYT